MKYMALLPATLDWVSKATAPGIIASGSLALQILLASMAILSVELWRLHGKLR
jgi:hypothetical protein